MKVPSSYGRLEARHKALGTGEGEVVGVCCRGEERRGEERRGDECLRYTKYCLYIYIYIYIYITVQNRAHVYMNFICMYVCIYIYNRPKSDTCLCELS